MTTLSAHRPAARTAATNAALLPAGLGARVLAWFIALDAGYRNAHKLAHATDAHLADMGLTRAEAEAEFFRRTGTVDMPTPTGW